MDLSGLNQFGSLTTQSGKRLTFEDFDLNKDGKITDAEFNRALSNWGLDSLELSSIDQNKDNIITEEEFANFELEAEINQVLNDFINTTVSSDTDLIGSNLKYGQQVTSELKAWVDEFKAQYTGDSEQMIADLKAQLPGKFNQIKAEVLANTPDQVQSRVLDDMNRVLIEELSAQYPDLTEDAIKEIRYKLTDKLYEMGSKFVESYTGDNLEADLKAYLELALNGTKAEILADAINKFENGEHGEDVIDPSELATYKSEIKELLMAAIANGIILNIDGSNIASESAINSLLAKYSDGLSLNNMMIDLLEQIKNDKSTMKDDIVNGKLDEIEAEKEAEAREKELQAEKEAEAKEKAFKEKLSNIKIDSSSAEINYSEIPGYYDDTTITRPSTSSTVFNHVKNQAADLLKNSLYEEFKQQVTEQLNALGISFKEMEGLFENSFNKALTETLETCVECKKWWNIGFQASFNVKELVDTFIAKFNEIFSAEMKDMNTSEKDLDINTIDLSSCYTNKNGTVNEELQEALENGTTIDKKVGLFSSASKTKGAMESLANDMIERLQSEMLSKAKAMCRANGVKFDSEVFQNIFENAKEQAVLSSITEKRDNIFSRKRIVFDPQGCINTFLTTFENAYTDWVNSEDKILTTTGTYAGDILVAKPHPNISTSAQITGFKRIF